MEYDLSKEFQLYTKQILEQYKEYIVKDKSISKKEQHEVTLFINCLFGLLMVPCEQNYENLSSDLRISDINERFKGSIECSAKNKSSSQEENLTFKEFIQSLRNGLGHWFESPNKSNKYTTGNEKNVEFESVNCEIDKLKIRGSCKRFKVETFLIMSIHNEEKIYEFLNLILEDKKSVYKEE